MTLAHRMPSLGPGAAAGRHRPNRCPNRRPGRPFAAPLLVFVLAGALTACSPPDWWNPFGGDDGQTREEIAAETYPNLARVPNAAPRPTPKSLRQSLTEGLIADRANASYTDEVLTAESTAAAPAAPPPKGRPRVELAWEEPRVLTKEQQAAADAAAEAEEAAAKALAAQAAAEEAAAEAAAEAAGPIEIAWNSDRAEPGQVESDRVEPSAASDTPDAAPRDPVEPAPLDGEPEAAAEAAAAEAAAAATTDEVEITWETARAEPAAEPEEAPSEDVVAEETAALEAVPDEAESAVQPLARIRFDVASSELNDRDQAALREVLAQQKERGGRLRMIGYADRPSKADDSVAQRTADLSLSLERASAVASALAGLGAAKDSLQVRAATAVGDGQIRSEIQIVEIFLEN